jgi:tetratricopeptide (TPR) repeat protein
LNLKKDQNAIDDCTNAIAFGKDNVDAHFTRAIAYSHGKKYVEAVKDMDKAIELDEMNAAAYLYRGEFKKELKDESACADVKRAAQLGDQQAVQLVERFCKK